MNLVINPLCGAPNVMADIMYVRVWPCNFWQMNTTQDCSYLNWYLICCNKIIYVPRVSEKKSDAYIFRNIAMHAFVKIIATSCNVFFMINTLKPRQIGRHFADDIFKGIFLNENVWIPTKMPLKIVPKGPINNLQHWFRQGLGAVQATSQYLNQWWLVTDASMRHSASMS